jgi:transposase-like protein
MGTTRVILTRFLAELEREGAVVASTMDLLGWLRKHLEAADTDLLREMVLGFVQALMGAEADALCGAALGERAAERVNQRNGYRLRRLDTRVGTLELAIPKLRAGSYFPEWLLEPRRRGERALVQVVAECYVRGVSTRRVEGLVQTLGITSLSKSQGAQVGPGAGRTLVRSIFAQPDAASTWAQHARIVTQLRERFPAAAELLAEAAGDLLAFTAFPKEHWRQIWSNNPQERLNKELRRRTDVVGIFPNRDAVVRLVGAVLGEQHDQWAIARRYMSAESLAKTHIRVIDGDGEPQREEMKELVAAG